MRVEAGIQAGQHKQAALTVPLESGRLQLQLIQVRHSDEGTPAERLLKTCAEPSPAMEHITSQNQNTASEHETKIWRQNILVLNWNKFK